MRYAMAAIPFLLAIGALPALADQLPASCGAVGAESYTPPAVTVPAVVLNRGTVITVTNATMAINGDTSSVRRWSPIPARTEFHSRKRSSPPITTPAHGTSSSHPR